MSLEQLELEESVHSEIARLCGKGDELANDQKFEDAITEYNKAWELIPEPKQEWEASTWILAALADSCFFLGKYKSARQALEFAMHCPGAIGNPFLHLRLGQALFETGELDRSADELIRAYMAEGSEIFAEDDPKYLAFLGTRAKI